jgi:hypothetical protein
VVEAWARKGIVRIHRSYAVNLRRIHTLPPGAGTYPRRPPSAAPISCECCPRPPGGLALATSRSHCALSSSLLP